MKKRLFVMLVLSVILFSFGCTSSVVIKIDEGKTLSGIAFYTGEPKFPFKEMGMISTSVTQVTIFDGVDEIEVMEEMALKAKELGADSIIRLQFDETTDWRRFKVLKGYGTAIIKK